MTHHGHIQVKRVYQPRSASDGHRVLVDRIWPRGLSRAAADLDEWCQDVAPSTTLRHWYRHDRTRFEQFRERYLIELDDPVRSEAVARLRAITQRDSLTLLTATKELSLSQARVLAERLSWGQATDQPTTCRVRIDQQ